MLKSHWLRQVSKTCRLREVKEHAEQLSGLIFVMKCIKMKNLKVTRFSGEKKIENAFLPLIVLFSIISLYADQRVFYKICMT
jgi:hypothetical protein